MTTSAQRNERDGPSKGAVEPGRTTLAGYVKRTTTYRKDAAEGQGAMNRVRTYVDGMNLYHGLHDRYGRRYHWFDLQALAASLLKPKQTLEQVTYFTARVRNDPSAELRQLRYLKALTEHCPRVRIVDGRFQEKRMTCRRCRTSWTSYEEKETDVSIAVALVEDAALDRFDTAVILSADSDLCPAVRSVKRVDATKKVIAAFPPKRFSGELKAHTDGVLYVGQDKIRKCQLPNRIVRRDGTILERPAYWS